jgi:hypothetical protein
MLSPVKAAVARTTCRSGPDQEPPRIVAATVEGDVSVRLKHVKHTPKIDMTTWWFGEDDVKKLTDEILSMTTRLVQSIFDQSGGPQLFFPIKWEDNDEDGCGGPAVSDPATMYVGIPLGPSDDDCIYSLSLEEAVDDLIDLHGRGSEEGCPLFRRLAERFRELAAKLDEACARE